MKTGHPHGQFGNGSYSKDERPLILPKSVRTVRWTHQQWQSQDMAGGCSDLHRYTRTKRVFRGISHGVSRLQRLVRVSVDSFAHARKDPSHFHSAARLAHKDRELDAARDIFRT